MKSQKCTHVTVCRHAQEDDCTFMEFCKHYESPLLVSTGKPKGKGKRRSRLSLDPDVKEDVARARTILGLRKKAGLLSENQISALEATNGVHFKSMNELQKKQIIDMVKDSQEKKDES